MRVENGALDNYRDYLDFIGKKFFAVNSDYYVV